MRKFQHSVFKAMQKCVDLVDLVKSFPMSIYLLVTCKTWRRYSRERALRSLACLLPTPDRRGSNKQPCAHVSAPWPYHVAIHTITRAVLMHHFAGTFQRLECAFPLQGISHPEAVPYGCTKHEDQRAIIKSRPRREPSRPRP